MSPPSSSGSTTTGAAPRSSTGSSVRHFQDPAAALLAFDAGEIHFTYITADEVERERGNTNAIVLPGNSGVDNGISANYGKHPEFKDPRVRNALLMAIDRQSIVDSIYGGAANIVPCLYGLPNLTGNVAPDPYDPAAKAAARRAGVDLSNWARSSSTRTTPTRCPRTS